MKKLYSTLIFMVACQTLLLAQTALPYVNNFDEPNDTIGWSHMALQGVDSWEWGQPHGSQLKASFTQPYAWCTNLTGSWVGNSIMALESPAFDFSDTSKTYQLTIAHQLEATGYHGGNIEYSINNGNTWVLLNGGPNQKENWYNNATNSGMNNEPSWSHNYYFWGFRISTHNLGMLVGLPNVKFRLKFGGSTNPSEGWVVDHFTITENTPNVYHISSGPTQISPACPTFDITTTFVYAHYNPAYFINKTNYYLSADSILDANDVLLATVQGNVNASDEITKTLNTPANIASGKQYVLIESDALNNLAENNETDNVCVAKLYVEVINPMPLISDFDDGKQGWEAKENRDWQLQPGTKFGLEGTHSGDSAWSIFNTGNYEVNYIESPHVDVSSSDSTVFSMWYRLKKNIINFPYYSAVMYKTGCAQYPENVADLPKGRENTWDFVTAYLPEKADTSKDVQLRIYNGNGYTGNCCFNGIDMVVDDIYIGPSKPDLSIERDIKNHFSSTSFLTDTLFYYLNNSGLKQAPASSTAFYWSTDSILDASDVLLGTKIEPALGDTAREWRSFGFTKPTTAAGTYYIFYTLDAYLAVDEMREYNNSDYFVVHQAAPVTVPYFNDFETQIAGWRHNSSFGFDDWQWGTPNGTVLNQPFSGTKAWVTNDTGLVRSMSRMHLYTPIFDLSTSSEPVMEFDMLLDSHQFCTNCAGGQTNMSFSTDGGATWTVLDTTNFSYNRWYYNTRLQAGVDEYYYQPNWGNQFFLAEEKAFQTMHEYNGRDAERNTRYILDLTFLAGESSVQFRFNTAVGVNNYNQTYYYEGALIDNFRIREAAIDLAVKEKKTLFVGSRTDFMRFSMFIKNQGNYMTAPSVAEFYLSQDTILDANDLLLGSENIPFIRPDLRHYLVANFPIAANTMANYTYLLYKLDATNANTESDELNNIGYWPLGVDSMHAFPYLQTFEDSVLHGWNAWAINPYMNQKSPYRMRHKIAPAEVIYQNVRRNGEMFNDPPYYGGHIPEYYLTSPVFDFSQVDSINLSFDLMCTGANSNNDRDGGNLQFSTNGGKNWTVFTSAFGDVYNWYDHNNLNNLHNGQPGWNEQPYPPTGTPVLDSVYANVSVLRGYSNVQFRFQYRSKHETWGAGTLSGFRLDNFKITTGTLNYTALDSAVLVNANVAQGNVPFTYQIENTGQLDGRASVTKFYWSTDSILDAGDIEVLVQNQAGIASGTTVTNSANLVYPLPVVQPTYYLFYHTDAQKDVAESNEEDNVGSFLVNFPLMANYTAISESDSVFATKYAPNFELPYSIVNNGLQSGAASTTEFYWSTDSLFDAADIFISSKSEGAILMGDTLTDTVALVYPQPLAQPTYFVITKVDANETVSELDENDNWCAQLVQFDYFHAIDDFHGKLNVFVTGSTLVIDNQSKIAEETFQMHAASISGQTILNQQIELTHGVNKFQLPENVAQGVYVVTIKNNHGQYTQKVIL